MQHGTQENEAKGLDVGRHNQEKIYLEVKQSLGITRILYKLEVHNRFILSQLNSEHVLTSYYILITQSHFAYASQMLSYFEIFRRNLCAFSFCLQTVSPSPSLGVQYGYEQLRRRPTSLCSVHPNITPLLLGPNFLLNASFSIILKL